MRAAAACLALALLWAPSTAAAKEPGLRVLASFLPMYVFTVNVTGEARGVTVELLLPATVGGPHDYSLTPGDMKRIASADLFIANGCGMEEFLGSAAFKAARRVKVVETARAVPPLRVPAAGRDPGDVNPHTWVSPRNAVLQVREIEKALSAEVPEAAPLFRRNADAYTARLRGLAREYEEAAQRFRNRNIVTFHNAFDYLARDLGLNIVGRIEETAGQEPSAGEIETLIRAIREKNVAAVFAEPQYPARLAEMIAAEGGVPVRILDPVATGPAAPSTYEDVMRRNLRTLTEVLGPR